jgi:fatty-acyl-CoA synthase
MLIFTSGTSGDPKAVICSHGKVAIAGVMMTERFGLGSDDICYVSMPLFHSNAVLVGWAVSLACQGSMVLRRKFSASPGAYHASCRPTALVSNLLERNFTAAAPQS